MALLSKTRLLIGDKEPVRFSYANVFQPVAFQEGAKSKYQVSVLIPKSDKATMDEIKSAWQNAVNEGKEKFGSGFKAPTSGNYFPIHDGDEKESEEYAGHWYLTAKSLPNRPPKVLNRMKQEISEDSGEFYSGCYGAITVNFYPYQSIAKGVGVGLGNIIKLVDGDKLGGGSASPDSDFKDLDLPAIDVKIDPFFSDGENGGTFNEEKPF